MKKSLIAIIITLFLSPIINLQAQQVGVWGSNVKLPWQISAYENLLRESELAGQSLGRLLYLYKELSTIPEDHPVKEAPHNQELIEEINLSLFSFVNQVYGVTHPKHVHVLLHTMSDDEEDDSDELEEYFGHLCIQGECFSLDLLLNIIGKNTLAAFKEAKELNNLQLTLNSSARDFEFLKHYIEQHLKILRNALDPKDKEEVQESLKELDELSKSEATFSSDFYNPTDIS